jgi:hypothetical protein
MTAIRATFDGDRVILPPEATGHGPGTVIVIFEDGADADRTLWAVAQESALAKVWDNPDDAIYDDL